MTQFPAAIAEIGFEKVESLIADRKAGASADTITDDFRSVLDHGIQLQRINEPEAASLVFGYAFKLNPGSADALMARLTCFLKIDKDLPEDEVAALGVLNEPYFLFLQGLQVRKEHPDDPGKILTALRDGFEGFHTGSEPDWLFIRQAMRIIARIGRPAPPAQSEIPEQIFMYWDHDPPREIAENIAHHKSLDPFRCFAYDRKSAADFLRAFYGEPCRQMFLALEHPSEQSDFFRFHAVNRLGGYYVDADERIVSVEQFRQNFVSRERAAFVISRNPDGSDGPIESALFGAVAGHPIIQEALLCLYRNIHLHPELSLWLKTGPGPLTRAISRVYYNALFLQRPLPSFTIFERDVMPRFVAAVEVSYRGDHRDWRVHEARNSA